MRTAKILCASVFLAISASASVSARPQSKPMDQKNMSAHKDMAMSTADMNAMMACHKMSRTAMMKNKRCSTMMKAHPSMMKMSAGDMKVMMACHKMTAPTRMKDERCTAMMKMHSHTTNTH